MLMFFLKALLFRTYMVLVGKSGACGHHVGDPCSTTW